MSTLFSRSRNEKKAKPEGLTFFAVAARSLLGPGLLGMRDHTQCVVAEPDGKSIGSAVADEYTVTYQYAVADQDAVANQDALSVYPRSESSSHCV